MRIQPYYLTMLPHTPSKYLNKWYPMTNCRPLTANQERVKRLKNKRKYNKGK